MKKREIFHVKETARNLINQSVSGCTMDGENNKMAQGKNNIWSLFDNAGIYFDFPNLQKWAEIVHALHARNDEKNSNSKFWSLFTGGLTSPPSLLHPPVYLIGSLPRKYHSTEIF